MYQLRRWYILHLHGCANTHRKPITKVYPVKGSWQKVTMDWWIGIMFLFFQTTFDIHWQQVEKYYVMHSLFMQFAIHIRFVWICSESIKLWHTQTSLFITQGSGLVANCIPSNEVQLSGCLSLLSFSAQLMKQMPHWSIEMVSQITNFNQEIAPHTYLCAIGPCIAVYGSIKLKFPLGTVLTFSHT